LLARQLLGLQFIMFSESWSKVMQKPAKPGRVSLSLARILNATSVVCFRIPDADKMIGPRIRITHQYGGVTTVWEGSQAETSIVTSNSKKYLVATVQCKSINRSLTVIETETLLTPESLEVTVTNSNGESSDVNTTEEAVVFP
jgi:hypothetical protein